MQRKLRCDGVTALTRGAEGQGEIRRARGCPQFPYERARRAFPLPPPRKANAYEVRAPKISSPTWGRSGRGKPRFGVRQSSLASPTSIRPHAGGGGTR